MTTHNQAPVNERTRVNWQPIIEISIAAIMVIGTVVPLYIHTDGKLHEALADMRAETKEYIKKHDEDMKKRDMEFRDIHGKMCTLEERNKA